MPEIRQSYLGEPLQTRTLVRESEGTGPLRDLRGKETEAYGAPAKGLDVFTSTSLNLCKVLVSWGAVTIYILAKRNCSSETVSNLIMILAQRSWELDRTV